MDHRNATMFTLPAITASAPRAPAQRRAQKRKPTAHWLGWALPAALVFWVLFLAVIAAACAGAL